MRGRPGKQAVYTYPVKKALAVVMEQVRSLTRWTKHRTLARLRYALNPVWRGWCNYFRHGVSARTFSYLDHFTWWRIVGWLRKRPASLSWGTFTRRLLSDGQIRDGRTAWFRPGDVPVVRYRYRGTRIPTPGRPRRSGPPHWSEPAESRMR